MEMHGSRYPSSPAQWGSVTGTFTNPVTLDGGNDEPHVRWNMDVNGDNYQVDVNDQSLENPNGAPGSSDVQVAVKNQVVPSMPAPGVSYNDTESYVQDGVQPGDFQVMSQAQMQQLLMGKAQNASEIQAVGSVFHDPPKEGEPGVNGVHDTHMNSGDPTRPDEPDGLVRFYTQQNGQTVQSTVYMKFQSQQLPGETVDSQGLMPLAAEVQAELTALRRDIHAHPELGMEETRTSALVARSLRGWGVQVTEGVGQTGVVGTIHGRPGSRAVGLRADMDALALTEETGAPYASQVPGRMHACGHDGHTAMLLGAARVLAESRDFAGTVHCIFQPAEEGRGGAKAMLRDGLFDRFECDTVYGLHSAPGVAAGHFATAAAVVGEAQVNTAMRPSTGAEDFAFMLEARPGAFMFIGNGLNPDGSFHAIHTPRYDFNDDVLPTGVAYWVQLVRQELG